MPAKLIDWPPPRHYLNSSKLIGRSRLNVSNVVQLAGTVLTVLTLAALASPLRADDDFPIVGTYTENQVCKADGSDPGVSRVKITRHDIDSLFGLCTILSKKREGPTFMVHVECKGPGGSQMLGDVNFTPREDKTIDFSDQDQTYKAVLYRCPD
ncbi:MAG: hypothetical protein E6G77_01215 [Alphaproteobacteria bacterium]|nr:MAG: hypothetical protein E6G77_01215 [Alphaproteobacteria bacterium]